MSPPPSDDPRARTYVVDHVAPGGTVERTIAVGSTTGEPLDVRLYVGDVDVVDHHLVPEDGEGDEDLARWTTITPSPAIALGPDGRATADVRIEVPDDADEGERLGVVWAETSTGDEAVSRVGIRVYLSVGDGEAPAPDVAADRLDDGRLRLRNDGRRAADVGATVEVDGAEPVPLDAVTLLAGDEMTLAAPAGDEVVVRLTVNGVEQVARFGRAGESTGPWPFVAAAAAAAAAAAVARSRPSRRSAGPGRRGRAPRS